MEGRTKGRKGERKRKRKKEKKEGEEEEGRRKKEGGRRKEEGGREEGRRTGRWKMVGKNKGQLTDIPHPESCTADCTRTDGLGARASAALV